MNVGEWIALSSVAGMTLGGILVYVFKFGSKTEQMDNLRTSFTKMKEAFVSHTSNSRIHIDPERDDEAWDDLKKSIADGFAGVKADMHRDKKEYLERLKSIEGHCKARGETCSEHFGKIERKVAAISGKPNGD